ncbi:MAG TPA: 1,2-phenylacetyl-CoA epoxidase subunit PaaD, partial [Bacteroidia bacterium]|nr:1,2-phenylacetyl-CoA epoxidase subunit PaaD [Bacteroidia bacterium]
MYIVMGDIHHISNTDAPRVREVIKILDEVSDPEIPVLTVNDMGIIRDVKFIGELLEISITPTYSGCPAMDAISVDITKALRDHGYKNVKIKTVLSPAWTTDWLTESGKEKLMKYGISPPEHSANKKSLLGEEAV